MKKIAKTFLFPVVLWIVMDVLIISKGGNNIFATSDSLLDIFQSSVILVLIAVAVALPLSGGRWDFAPGAIMVVTSIISGNIAIKYQMGIAGLLILSILTAVLLALFEGILYIGFKVPTMIISLGVVMLYEGISGIIYDGSGVRLFMYENLSVLVKQPYCYIVMVLVLIVFHVLMKYTKFGFDTRSLGNHAVLAINNGVNEKRTILLTYLVVGVLLGCASLLNASKVVVAPAANLSSTQLMFSSMGAVLTGLYLSRFSNMSFGILAGTISMSVFTKGLTVYGLPSSLNNIILGIFIVSFMGITTNMEALKRLFRRKVKVEG